MVAIAGITSCFVIAYFYKLSCRRDDFVIPTTGEFCSLLLSLRCCISYIYISHITKDSESVRVPISCPGPPMGMGGAIVYETGSIVYLFPSFALVCFFSLVLFFSLCCPFFSLLPRTGATFSSVLCCRLFSAPPFLFLAAFSSSLFQSGVSRSSPGYSANGLSLSGLIWT